MNFKHDDNVTIYDDNDFFTFTPKRYNKGNSKISISDLKESDKKTLENAGIRTEEIDSKDELIFDNLEFAPNQKTGMFKLKFTLPGKGPADIKIYDIRGNIVFHEKIKNLKETYSKEIDLSQNGKGTFFLQIAQGKKIMSKKIKVQ